MWCDGCGVSTGLPFPTEGDLSDALGYGSGAFLLIVFRFAGVKVGKDVSEPRQMDLELADEVNDESVPTDTFLGGGIVVGNFRTLIAVSFCDPDRLLCCSTIFDCLTCCGSSPRQRKR